MHNCIKCKGNCNPEKVIFKDGTFHYRWRCTVCNFREYVARDKEMFEKVKNMKWIINLKRRKNGKKNV